MYDIQIVKPHVGGVGCKCQYSKSRSFPTWLYHLLQYLVAVVHLLLQLLYCVRCLPDHTLNLLQLRTIEHHKITLPRSGLVESHEVIYSEVLESGKVQVMDCYVVRIMCRKCCPVRLDSTGVQMLFVAEEFNEWHSKQHKAFCVRIKFADEAFCG